MSLFLSNVKYFPTSSVDATDIVDHYEITVDMGSEIKNDSMTIKLKNGPVNVFSDGSIQHKWVDVNGNMIFQIAKPASGTVVAREVVKVYAHYEETNSAINIVSDDYLLFDSVLNKCKIKWKSSEHSIELEGVNRNYIVLNKVCTPQNYDIDLALNSPEILQRVIRLSVSGVTDDAYGFDASGNYGLGLPYYVDARLFTEGIVDSGTTDGTTARKLVDSGQNFLTTVSVGDWVKNTVTFAHAYVTAIDDNDTLSLSKDIFVSGQGYSISNGFIQDWRPDGTAFPDISFSQINQPVTESVTKLGQPENTNTVAEQTPVTGTMVVKRGCRWFIDRFGRFHWYVPSDTPEYYFETGATAAVSPDIKYHKIIDVDLDNELGDETNFIIFKAGVDMNNIQIKSYARAQFSGRPERKDSLRIWEHIARGMKQQDLQAGNLTLLGEDDYDYPASYSPLPSGNNSPSWDRQGRTPANDGNYNTYFREEAILRGRDLAQSVFQNIGNLRWKGKIQIRGENMTVGDLINFTSKQHGMINQKLRIKQITHSITPEQGWITTLNVEEDEIERTQGSNY